MIRPPTSTACLAACLAVALALALLAAPAALGVEKGAPPPSNAPSPAESAPLSTTTDPNPAAKPGRGTASPTPDKALTPPAAPGAAPAASPAPPARQTLVPAQGDGEAPEPVTLPAKPAAILSGKVTWEEIVPVLKGAFGRIEGELARAGIRPTGRPLAVLTNPEEDGVEYEAMIPIEAAPSAGPASGDGVRFGATPGGKALRYRHSGAYAEIGGTYEMLNTYAEAKDIPKQDRFVEEYATDLNDDTDEKLDVNIYALLK